MLVIIMLIAGSYTLLVYTQEEQDNLAYEGVDKYIEDVGPDYTPSDEIIDFGTEESGIDKIKKYQMEYDWDGLLQLNEDIVGWLYVPGNEIINFPVVQGINNNFYLQHDYTGKYSGYGAAFVDYRFNKYSLNKIIYGHNMSLTPTKPIFTTIISWLDEDYFNSHRTLYYTEANGLTKEYLIVGVVNCNVYAKDEYSYLDTFFESEEKLKEWVEYMKEHSVYFDLGDNEVEYRADEVITLSTCNRKIGYGSGGRTVLFCVNLTNNTLNK